MSIGLSFEAQIQDVSEAREEVMDLAEQWNIAAFPDENSVSLSFCPIGILEIPPLRTYPTLQDRCHQQSDAWFLRQ